MTATGRSTTLELPLAGPARLRFHGDFVNVIAVPVSEGQAPRMTVEPSESDEEIRVEVVEREGTVFATVEHQDRVRGLLRTRWRDRWGVVCRLELPSTIEATLETEAGRIEARNLGGVFDFRTDAGQIVLSDLRGQLHLQTNAGKADCIRFAGSIDASTNAGTINLVIQQLDTGVHRVRADVGKIDVSLPREAAVRLETRTSIGRTRNDFGSGHPDAPALLRLQTEVGAITVRVREPAEPHAGQLPARMSDEERQAQVRRILDQVASHEISAEEAGRRIAALG